MKNPKTLRDIIFRITRIISGLRFETDFLKKVQKNLDNYIYIYILAPLFAKQKAGI